jgi:hypothetical protein
LPSRLGENFKLHVVRRFLERVRRVVCVLPAAHVCRMISHEVLSELFSIQTHFVRGEQDITSAKVVRAWPVQVTNEAAALATNIQHFTSCIYPVVRKDLSLPPEAVHRNGSANDTSKHSEASSFFQSFLRLSHSTHMLGTIPLDSFPRLQRLLCNCVQKLINSAD